MEWGKIIIAIAGAVTAFVPVVLYVMKRSDKRSDRKSDKLEQLMTERFERSEKEHAECREDRKVLHTEVKNLKEKLSDIDGRMAVIKEKAKRCPSKDACPVQQHFDAK